MVRTNCTDRNQSLTVRYGAGVLDNPPTRVTNCSRMQISELFSSEGLHNRPSGQKYLV